MIFITFSLLAAFFSALFVCAAPIPISIQHRDDSSSDITQYLFAHNYIRFSHGAVPLIWSDDLASGAQQWADACQFQHSNGQLSELPYGENIAAATGTFGISAAVESFLNQDSYDPLSPTFSAFTQIVWKDTTSVGCAYNTQCANILPGQATLHVCLYNPPGNVVGLVTENVQGSLNAL